MLNTFGRDRRSTTQSVQMSSNVQIVLWSWKNVGDEGATGVLRPPGFCQTKTGTLSTDVHRCPTVYTSQVCLKYCQVVKLSFYSSFLLFRPACPRLPGQYLSKGVVIFAKFRPGVAN